MGWFSKEEVKSNFPWIEITSIKQLEEIISHSGEKIILLFKHSTRCSISSMVLKNFERNIEVQNENIVFYFLDLITHRDISNKIEELTGVIHQSPQVIVLKENKVIYHNSHNGIDPSEINKLN